MKILLINDYLTYGGAEKYTINLMEILEKSGHKVALLCFDKEFDEKLDKDNKLKNKEIYNIRVSKLSKILFNPLLFFRIKKILKNFKPDKIIVNNIFTSPITELFSFKGYDSYQVVHDYGIVCPKSTCIRDNFEVCLGYKKANCTKSCKYHSSTMLMNIKLFQLKVVEKLRKRYIKLLISPSEYLNKYLKEYGYNSVCINNPIMLNKDTSICENKFNTKKFIYVGGINSRKGIFEFLNAFVQFSKDKDLEIDLIGKIDTNENKTKLKKILDSNTKIKYLGELNNDKALLNIKEAYCIVVPSLWIENYPTTVLEAQSNKTLVLGSNRGGIPEMLEDDRGYVFDILNVKQTIQTLEKIYKLQKEEYKKIVENAYNYVRKNNSFEEYAKKIIGVIEG